MQEFDTSKHARADIDAALTSRPTETLTNVEAVVRDILADVRARGDEAVVDYTRRFDWPEATASTLEVPQSELIRANGTIDAEAFKAPRVAAENITNFHRAEMGQLQSWMKSTGPGRILGQVIQPVKRVGIYVPGGKAFYPSTVLMAAIPARVAGVEEVILCTPAGKDGDLHPLIKALAYEHVDRVFKIGGAQAIGAMAYGTDTVPRVDVIVGPGNDYVNVAKRMVYGEVGIDMLAGPSEVGIIADELANPAYVVADLLAQTEHGPENRGILISPSTKLLDACKQELVDQRAKLSRQAILQATDANLVYGKTTSLAEAVDIANTLAAEHLELCVAEPLSILGSIRNAGAILLGENTSAPAGDYIAGPSHTLPTAGTARFSSPLSCDTFLKRSSEHYHDAATAAALAADIAAFATAEGFDAHAAAALIRNVQ